MNKIDILKRIVSHDENGGCFKTTVQDKNGKNKKVLIDITTAGMILNVYNRASKKGQEKMETFSWSQLLYVQEKIYNLNKKIA